MTHTERASLEFKAPYPRNLPVYWVCPHCKQETSRCVVSCDNHDFATHYCEKHGDVIAIPSHVRNETYSLEALNGHL